MTKHQPAFGHTEDGIPVHRDRFRYLEADSVVGRFNQKVAVLTTKGVGSMWCAYVFAAIALFGLPAAIRGGVSTIVVWTAQTFLQLVLLSIILVGQQVLGAATDAREVRTLELVQGNSDSLDLDTQGGLAEVLDEVKALRAEVARLRGGSSG